MPSSTSSSESRLWRRTWLATLALSLAFVMGWEGFWRLQGFFPRINSNQDLWVLARRRAANAGHDAVILVGSSRMQLGIDADSFSEATGWRRPIQLAIPMAPALPILQDLVEDPSISGTIICEINPVTFFDATHQLDPIPVGHLRRRSAFTPADVVEAHLRTFSQRTLVSGRPALFPQQLLRAWSAGRWPVSGHVRFDVERFARADFRAFDGLDEYRKNRRVQWKRWKGRPATPAEISKTAAHLNDLLDTIRDRGGDVVFVRIPTSGEVREREEQLFPRSRFWDVFARNTDALTVHFEDYPELRVFRMPDGSHLDQRDTPAFSKALGAILVRELKRRARTAAPGGTEHGA